MSAATSQPAALELDQLTKRFGKAEIIRGVSLSIAAGERHAIIGPNGAGKSTLFNLISGRFAPSSGSVRLNGESITGKTPFEIYRRGLARSFQITNIFPKLSVFENLRCALLWTAGHGYAFWRNLNRLSDVAERAETLLRDVGLRGRRDTAAGLLTYAEQRALELAITIAGRPQVILLDEPTAGMSRHETASAVALIRRLTEGRTLVMVEHDMSVVFGLADRISVLVYGEVIASGPPEQIRADPRVKEAYLGQSAESTEAGG
jgi:branched-chain amino acid transport system ATP-binding protein